MPLIKTVCGVVLSLSQLAAVPGFCSQLQPRAIVGFQPRIDVIIVPVTIGVAVDAPALFILDTAMTGHVLDASFQPSLGKPIRKVPAALGTSRGTVEEFNCPALQLDAINVTSNEPVVCLDLKSVSEVVGEPIAGVLGIPFFQNRVVTIDCDRYLLEVSDALVAGIVKDAAPIIMKPRGKSGASIRLAVCGAEVDFLVDSACSLSGTIAERVVPSLLASKCLKEVSATNIVDAGGIRQAMCYEVESIAVDGWTQRHLIFSSSDQSMIGLPFLARFIVTIDWPNNKMYLKKGKQYATQEVADVTGIHLLKRNGLVIIERVDEGSNAHTAGLAAGDVLVSANRKKPTEFHSLFELRDTLKTQVREGVQIEVLRGEEVLMREIHAR